MGAKGVPDPVWDTMEDLFGVVVARTNAHAKRNRAVRDLKLLGATPETIRRASNAWPRLFNNATLTDIALATHYPQLCQTAGIRDGAVPTVCPECEVGGGLHAQGCSRPGVAA